MRVPRRDTTPQVTELSPEYIFLERNFKTLIAFMHHIRQNQVKNAIALKLGTLSVRQIEEVHHHDVGWTSRMVTYLGPRTGNGFFEVQRLFDGEYVATSEALMDYFSKNSPLRDTICDLGQLIDDKDIDVPALVARTYEPLNT